MLIGRFCNRDVVFTTRSNTIKEAAQIMRDHHVGDLVVIDEHKSRRVPCGIITDRDIVVGVVAKNVDPNAVTVGEVMGPQLVVGHETDEVSTTAEVMRSKGVRRIPVVNAQGELVGIVTADDIVDQLAQSLSAVAATASVQQRREAGLRSR
jgi:CBS domain-containing protein